jgi:hypothetical protein
MLYHKVNNVRCDTVVSGTRVFQFAIQPVMDVTIIHTWRTETFFEVLDTTRDSRDFLRFNLVYSYFIVSMRNIRQILNVTSDDCLQHNGISLHRVFVTVDSCSELDFTKLRRKNVKYNIREKQQCYALPSNGVWG